MVKMRARFLTLIAFALFAGSIFVYPRPAPTCIKPGGFQQRPGQGRRRIGRTPRKPVRDYSKFSHATPSEHRLACAACHMIPTNNWREASDYPDVTDYPDHDACLRCHRQQFFSGASPSICADCHTHVSPRDGSRFPFQKPSGPRQFLTKFPHDIHQNIIAANPPSRETGGDVRFLRASFAGSGAFQDDKEKRYSNCSICHLTDKKESQPPPPGGWVDSFAPPAGTFKTVPSGHASCFNCHWQGQKPTRTNCAGCHELSATYRPMVWHRRISAKFTHLREQHVLECTACHINITRASTLRGLKPDVPITSCGECHRTSTDKSIVTIGSEMNQRAKNPGFICLKCHTSDVGRRAAPPSHDVVLNP